MQPIRLELEGEMTQQDLPVTAMFEELVRLGHIRVPEKMNHLRLPGAYAPVPSIVVYSTPDITFHNGGSGHAKLGQYTPRDNYYTNDSK